MEVRSLSAQIRAISKENRTVEFIISDGSIDRHMTVINPRGWRLDNYNKNGIVGYQHNVHGAGMLTEPNPDYVIGKGEAYMEGDQLIGRVTFEPESINQLAEKIYQKVLHGTLKAASVGFNDIRSHWEGDILHYDEVELLEYSIVNIPSNPNAIKRQAEQQSEELTPQERFYRLKYFHQINS